MVAWLGYFMGAIALALAAAWCIADIASFRREQEAMRWESDRFEQQMEALLSPNDEGEEEGP